MNERTPVPGTKEKNLSTTSATLYGGESEIYEVDSVHNESVEIETQWLKEVITKRLEQHKNNPDGTQALPLPELCPLPELPESSYTQFIQDHQWSYMERLILMLALAAEHEQDMLQDLLSTTEHINKRPYGGIVHTASGKCIPTLDTAIFLLSGNNRKLKKQFKLSLTARHPLFKTQIVELLQTESQLSRYNDPALALSHEYTTYFLTGKRPRLDYGDYFPAELLEVDASFDDLVLNGTIRENLDGIIEFLTNSPTLFSPDKPRKKYSRGYIVMFYGPPGTGKTMTAGLIAKECNIPIYRIDLSRVISKYIGETEKNLEKVFARLEGKQVILFFDEADALFGKRTEIMDSKDKYANQEISYLLQRVEKWNGVVILATNYQQNLDVAFSRRIVQQIHFEPPGAEERLQLWLSILSDEFSYESEELPKVLAGKYPFTGANIATVIKRASIAALHRNTNIITKEIINPLIRDECMQNNMRQEYRSL